LNKFYFVNRIVLPEILDVLPPQDSAALRSRRDLRRINAWMRHPRIMARVLQENLSRPDTQDIIELGAGDGHFLLSVAKNLNGHGAGTRAILVDRLNAVDPRACDEFNRLGWVVQTKVSEAADWLRQATPGKPQTIISNLFFHQFKAEELAEMLRLAASSAQLVIALEPRRSWASRVSGRMLWAIGCSRITLHDADISIRAGFVGNELSELWPDKKNWHLTEQPVGLFSHLFIARRKE
jgi:hypothetical protein